jgi:hypothetical protein
MGGPGFADLVALQQSRAGRIRDVKETNPSRSGAHDSRPRLPRDESRLLMMRRVKVMTVEERLALFEQLSRRVTWARSAKRVR